MISYESNYELPLGDVRRHRERDIKRGEVLREKRYNKSIHLKSREPKKFKSCNGVDSIRRLEIQEKMTFNLTFESFIDKIRIPSGI